MKKRNLELQKLEQYNDPIRHFITREWNSVRICNIKQKIKIRTQRFNNFQQMTEIQSYLEFYEKERVNKK